MKRYARVGQVNAKRGWGNAGNRMAGMLAMLDRADVTVFSLNEVNREQVGRVQAHPKWVIYAAPQNGGADTGNAIAWRFDAWRLGVAKSVALPFRYPLHTPTVRLIGKDPKSNLGAGLRLMGVHNPRHQDSTPRQLHEIRQRELKWMNRPEPGRITSVLGGDFNDDTPFPTLRKAGQSGPDIIHVHRGTDHGREVIHPAERMGLSDHDLLSVRIELDALRPKHTDRAERLP